MSYYNDAKYGHELPFSVANNTVNCTCGSTTSVLFKDIDITTPCVPNLSDQLNEIYKEKFFDCNICKQPFAPIGFECDHKNRLLNY